MNFYQIFALIAFAYSVVRVIDLAVHPEAAFKQFLLDYEVPTYHEVAEFKEYVRTWHWATIGLLLLNVFTTIIPYL